MGTAVIMFVLWWSVMFTDSQINGEPPEQTQIEYRIERMK